MREEHQKVVEHWAKGGAWARWAVEELLLDRGIAKDLVSYVQWDESCFRGKDWVAEDALGGLGVAVYVGFSPAGNITHPFGPLPFPLDMSDLRMGKSTTYGAPHDTQTFDMSRHFGERSKKQS